MRAVQQQNCRVIGQKKIFFLFLQCAKEYVKEKYATTESYCIVFGQKKKNFFSFFTFGMKGEEQKKKKKKKYSTSLHQKIFAQAEEEEILYFSSLENLCPLRYDPLYQQ